MEYYAIGLMSGTSLDGLDICYVKFSESNHNWQFNVIAAETIPYPEYWENQLRDAVHFSAEDLAALHSEYGFYLGEMVNQFIIKHHIDKLDLISSHGHTVFHQPHRKFTLQIGDARAIHILTKITTIYDFRTQDVLLGGNGAPLVPIGDEYLFSEFDACLNIGGFSNISLKENNKRIAFDICPANIILNYYAQKLEHKYDNHGDIAKSGKIDFQLLNLLNQIKFYHEKPPKSLGVEWLDQNIKPLINQQKPEDLLATFTEHAAVQISKIFNKYKISNVLVTGGGAYNHFLMERISYHSSTEIILPEENIINFKEALIFAMLGLLKLKNRINIFSSVTGASKDHSSGLICN